MQKTILYDYQSQCIYKCPLSSPHTTHQRTFLLRDSNTDGRYDLCRILHLKVVVLESRSNELEHVGHGHVSSNAHSMTHTKWAEESLKRLPALVEKSRGVKLVVVSTPDGGVVMDDVVKAEYNGLIAMLADSHIT